MPGPEDFYDDLKSCAEELGAQWAVAGALAAIEYRDSERFTTDADLLVSWAPGLVEAIEARGWQVRALADPGDTPHLIRARKGDQYVDLLIALTEYQMEALRRAVEHVLTVEDVLVHKIIAWRGRDRDDIESILRANHEIGWGYVRRWVSYFGFEARLDEIQPS